MPSPTPRRSTATRRAEIRASILGQMMGAVMPTLMREGGVASLLIIGLQGEDTETLIGLAYLIMQWSMFARVFAAPRVDISWRKHFLQRWLLISSIASISLLFAPFCGWFGAPRLGVWLFLSGLAVYFVTMQTGVTAWFPLLAYIVPSPVRGRYFGNMRRAWQITSFGIVFVSGAMLGRDPGMPKFLIVLLPAVVLQFGRVVAFTRLPDPPPARSTDETFSWRDLLVPLRDPPFVAFVGFTICMAMVQFAAIPFVVPFLRTELHFPAAIALYGSGCFGLGSVLSLVGWGRMADRGGTRLVFLLSGCVAIAALTTIACTPVYEPERLVAVAPAIGGMVLAGVAAAGIGIAYTVRLMRMAPERHASPYLNLCQSAIGLTAGIAAALIGAALGRLPDQVSMLGRPLLTFRLLFIAVSIFLAVVLLALPTLPRLNEPSLRQGLASILRRR